MASDREPPTVRDGLEPAYGTALALSAEHSDTLSGAYLGDDGNLVIATIDLAAAQDAVRAITRSPGLPGAATLEIVEVERSRAELEALAGEAIDMDLPGNAQVYSTAVDFAVNGIVVYVSDTSDEVRAAVHEQFPGTATITPGLLVNESMAGA